MVFKWPASYHFKPYKFSNYRLFEFFELLKIVFNRLEIREI